jgi:hypothetical protein
VADPRPLYAEGLGWLSQKGASARVTMKWVVSSFALLSVAGCVCTTSYTPLSSETPFLVAVHVVQLT